MAVELTEDGLQQNAYQSSKGNQLKWLQNGIWYKADYAGYEGLSEYVISGLLKKSTLSHEEYISYHTEEIIYRNRRLTGCRSENFLKDGWTLITLERLFKNAYGESLYQSIFALHEPEARLEFLVRQVENITGLKDFGKYIAKLLTLDAIFLNEDRHMHNIAVLESREHTYALCPIFDNGASLMSDLTLDYPLEGEIYQMISQVRSKTISFSFDEQMETAEDLFGETIHFSFTAKDIQDLLDADSYYPQNIKRRVETILLEQKRRYPYLFRD